MTNQISPGCSAAILLVSSVALAMTLIVLRSSAPTVDVNDQLKGTMPRITQIHAFGKMVARNERIVFCGLAKDCAAQLASSIQYVKRIGSHFRKYSICMLENDSSDDTRGWLRRHPDVDLAPCPGIEDIEARTCSIRLDDEITHEKSGYAKGRMARMAMLREHLRTHVLQTYPKATLICVIDPDLSASSTIDGFFTALGRMMSLSWDAVAIDGRLQSFIMGNAWIPYDDAAFRPFPLCDRSSLPRWTPNQTSMIQLAHNLNQGRSVRVTSAFNGMALYRRSVVESHAYSSRYGCEHVAFHQGMNMWIDSAWHSKVKSGVS